MKPQDIIIYILAAILLFYIIKYLKRAIRHKSLYPFMPLKYNFANRRITFQKTLELLKKRNVKTIIETGTSRAGLKGTKGDGAATIVFGKWALENNAKFYSVDISEESVKGSSEELKKQGLENVVSVILSDSLTFLENFKEKVDFLYLDSYDYSHTDVEIQRKSQEHHLKEFQLIEDKLHEDTIVLIDDCRLPNGGKGKTVIEYMQQKGWKIILNEYQVLLVKK